MTENALPDRQIEGANSNYSVLVRKSSARFILILTMCLPFIATRAALAQSDLLDVEKVTASSEKTYEVMEGITLVARAHHPFEKDLAPYAGLSSNSCNSTACSELLADPFVAEGYRTTLTATFPLDYTTNVDSLTFFTKERMSNLVSYYQRGNRRRGSRGYGRFWSRRLENGFWMNILDMRRIRRQAFTDNSVLFLQIYGSFPPVYAAAFKGRQERNQPVCEPPLPLERTGEGEQSGCHNSANPCDVNGDGKFTSLDVLKMTNSVNGYRSSACPTPGSAPYVDVNGDGELSPADMLYLTQRCR